MRLGTPRFGMKELLLMVACAAIGCYAITAYVEAGRPVAYRARQLRSWDTATRREAAADLLSMFGGAAEAVPALTVALGDRDTVVRATAAQVLGNVGKAARPALPALVVALRDPDPSVRSAAAAALGHLAGPAEVPALVAALGDPAVEVRRQAVATLRPLGPKARPAAPRLLVLLTSDPDDGVRAATAEALGSILGRGWSPTKSRIAALGSPDPRDRSRAAADLARDFGSQIIQTHSETRLRPLLRREAVPRLRANLTDRDAGVRRESIKLLNVIERLSPGPPRPLADLAPTFLALLREDRDGSVREAAAEAFVGMTFDHPDAGSIPALRAALRDDRVGVRRPAARLLARAADLPFTRPDLHKPIEAAAPDLLAALRDDDPLVHASALGALLALDRRRVGVGLDSRAASRDLTRAFCAALVDKDGALADQAFSFLGSEADPADADLVIPALRSMARGGPSSLRSRGDSALEQFRRRSSPRPDPSRLSIARPSTRLGP